MTAFYPPQVTDGSVGAQTYWHDLSRKGDNRETEIPSGSALAGNVACEVAIIGGGLTGLGAALSLARAGADACLLEAGRIGWGASTRNAGIWGPHPSGLHLETLLKRHGPQSLRGYMDQLRRASEQMLEFAEAEPIDLQRTGAGFIEVAHDPETFERLNRRMRLLETVLGLEARIHRPDEFAETGFVSDEQCGAVHFRFGFGLNPLNLTNGLAAAAKRQGAKLYEHSRVVEWQAKEGGHVLRTECGEVRARKVVLAVNGYLQDGLYPAFDKRMLPVLGNVLVTRPLTDPELQEQAWSLDEPCFSSAPDEPFFRLLPDRRFLFGARGGVDGSAEDEHRTREWLIWRMGLMFPAWKTFEVTHFWRGLMARTRDRTPAVGRLTQDPSVFYAFGFHGMGLAAAWWAGGMLAGAVTEGDQALRRIPPPLRGPARPWRWPDPRAGILKKRYRRDVM